MKIIAGSYTSLGGPGLALMELKGERLQMIGTTDAVKNPIWAECGKKGKVMFVAGAQGDETHACVASFLVEDDQIILLSRQENTGMECCHLCLNDEETCLYAANYVDGTVWVYPVSEDGTLGPEIQHIVRKTSLGPRKDRQEGNHAHQVLFRPGTDELFLCDLGADQVAVYRAGEDGCLTQTAAVDCVPGSGPRHLCFDGPDAFYLVGELDSTLSRYENKDGEWQLVQQISALPGGYQGVQNTAAAIRQDAGHVYVSNRGYDSIAVFGKEKDGKVHTPYFIRTPGICPRDFLVLGGGFLLAHQQSGTVGYMNENGVPMAQVMMPGAVCLAVMP